MAEFGCLRRCGGLLLACFVCLGATCEVRPPNHGGGGGGGAGQPPQAVVATLTATAGGVTVERGGGRVQYLSGMPIYRDDVIETDGGTYAVVQFADGNVVWLNYATRAQVGSLRLFFGEVFNAIGRRISGGGFDVFTNELTAAVGGTRFLVKRPRNQAVTTVTVVDGVVVCSPARGARWAAISLSANQQLSGFAQTRGSPLPANAVAEAAWVRNADSILRRQRLYKPVDPRLLEQIPQSPSPIR